MRNRKIIANLEGWSKRLEGRYMVSEEEIWGDIKRESIEMLKWLIEESMEYEIKEYIGANRYERASGRRGYRNGSYRRDLITSMGEIRGLRVPRAREGKVKFRVIERYKRRTREIDEVILKMFLEGVSTRDVGEVLRPIYGRKVVSSGLVSKIVKVLDKQVEKFHSRRIEDKYEYIILDGVWISVRGVVYKRKKCILVCYGMWEEKGTLKRELIDFMITAKGESEGAWNKFLTSLYFRGLEGKRLKLIISDGHGGLRKVLEYIYPWVDIQLCWEHKKRNMEKYLPKRLRRVMREDLKKIYNSKSYTEAQQEYKKFRKIWGSIDEKVVKCLDKDIEELLVFYKYPKILQKKLRTTNIIERVFREVRRKTKPKGCFNNNQSLERIIYAVCFKLNKKYNQNLKIMEDSLFYEFTQNC